VLVLVQAITWKDPSAKWCQCVDGDFKHYFTHSFIHCYWWCYWVLFNQPIFWRL